MNKLLMMFPMLMTAVVFAQDVEEAAGEEATEAAAADGGTNWMLWGGIGLAALLVFMYMRKN